MPGWASHRRKQLPHPADKLGIEGGIFGREVLEVDVQTGIALGADRLEQIFRGTVLYGGVIENGVGQFAGETAVLCLGGQMQKGLYA